MVNVNDKALSQLFHGRVLSQLFCDRCEHYVLSVVTMRR